VIDGLAQFLENQRSTVTHCTSYIIPDVGIITVTTEFEPFDQSGD
jgi:hypothetical protein